MKEMTKKMPHFLICLMVVLVSLLTQPFIVLGASTNAQVVVPSEISFYEDDESISHDSSTKKDNQIITSNSTVGKGILPQTGEVIKHDGFIGIIIILVVLLLFFLRKRRKDDEYES
ncbi:hypothetical protein CBF36_00010 [Vagococcus bubulae]|uniref:Gram-positive cocci surface proteins LPxTG domain-containing protein n=2 Tax=Vagococcus bubulae TaxID=1977868 RepID=A0A429ZR00_9ENTE|nr:hypothetical protein CBF36_00010 [Vagococcus bubulae]